MAKEMSDELNQQVTEAAVMESLAENRVVQKFYEQNPDRRHGDVSLKEIIDFGKEYDRTVGYDAVDEKTGKPLTENGRQNMEILESFFDKNSMRDPSEYTIHDYDRTWAGIEDDSDPQWETNLLVTSPEKADGKRDVYVAFRGTDFAEGHDNAEMVYMESTTQQREALKYFDSLVENPKYRDLFLNGDVYPVGHSKGGNKAMYVTMMSKNGHLIDRCISLDGPGYSPETLEMFMGNPDWEDRADKIIQIAGDSDYVHGTILPIVPPDNVYYLDTTASNTGDTFHDMASLHWNHYLFTTDKDGKFTAELNPAGEPAAYIRYEQELFKELSKLDPEQRKEAAHAVMMLLWPGDSPDGNNVDPNELVAVASLFNDPVRALFLICGVMMAINPSKTILKILEVLTVVSAGGWTGLLTILVALGIVSSKIYSLVGKEKYKKKKSKQEKLAHDMAQQNPEFWIDPDILAEGAHYDGAGNIGAQINSVQERLTKVADRRIPDRSIEIYDRNGRFDPDQIQRMQAQKRQIEAKKRQIEAKKKEIRQMHQDIRESVKQLEGVKQTLNAVVAYMGNTGTRFANVEQFLQHQAQEWLDEANTIR